MDKIIVSLAALIKRGVITVDDSLAKECCGIERDADGFCVHRPHHPIYVDFGDSNG